MVLTALRACRLSEAVYGRKSYLANRKSVSRRNNIPVTPHKRPEGEQCGDGDTRLAALAAQVLRATRLAACSPRNGDAKKRASPDKGSVS